MAAHNLSDSGKTVDLREANQAFVREVKGGVAFTITRNGTPVARLVPVDGAAHRLSPEQEAARARMRAAGRSARASSTAICCMCVERFSLDTNILVYALDAKAGNKHTLAAEIVDRAVERDSHLTLQALSVFYAVVTRKGIVPRMKRPGRWRIGKSSTRRWLLRPPPFDRAGARNRRSGFLLGCAPCGDGRRRTVFGSAVCGRGRCGKVGGGSRRKPFRRRGPFCARLCAAIRTA